MGFGGGGVKKKRVASPESISFHLTLLHSKRPNLYKNFGLSECNSVKYNLAKTITLYLLNLQTHPEL